VNHEERIITTPHHTTTVIFIPGWRDEAVTLSAEVVA
jgi:hypothetical protein